MLQLNYWRGPIDACPFSKILGPTRIGAPAEMTSFLENTAPITVKGSVTSGKDVTMMACGNVDW